MTVLHRDDVDPESRALLDAADAGVVASLRTVLADRPQLTLSARSRWGETALMRAAEEGHAECVSLLLAAHDPAAQVLAANRDGWTALILAAEEGHAECVSLLLAAHDPAAQVLAADSMGGTALMHAVGLGHAECVSLLLAHDPAAQVMAADRDGWTALKHAVVQAQEDGRSTGFGEGVPKCLRLLLDHDGHRLDSLTKALSECARLYTGWLPLLSEPEFAFFEPEFYNRVLEAAPVWRDCIERLLAKGASLPVHNVDHMLTLEPIMHDLLQQATLPDRISEALLRQRPGA